MNPITTAVRELKRGKYCIYPTSYKKDAEFYKKTSKILYHPFYSLFSIYTSVFILFRMTFKSVQNNIDDFFLFLIQLVVVFCDEISFW